MTDKKKDTAVPTNQNGLPSTSITRPEQLDGLTGHLGSDNLLNQYGLLAPDSLLGNTAGKKSSVLTNLVQPNKGNILK
jgi:hypothetical protein